MSRVIIFNAVLVLFLVFALHGSSNAQEYLPYCGAPSDLYVNNFANLTLRMVQVLTRHGDRTMVTRFANDHTLWECNLTFTSYPSTNNNPVASIDRLYRKSYMLNRQVINPGNCNLGQLTNKGYDQHFELGAQLRDLYVDTYNFLSPNFDPTEVWLRSTDVPRTIQSAQGLINGMYPQIYENASTFLPVLNLNVIDSDTDNLLPSSTLCPGLDALLVGIITSPDYVNYQNKYSSLLDSLQGVLNNNNTPPLQWTEIMDGFSALQCHNMVFPSGVDQTIVDTSYQIAYWQLAYIVANSTYVSYSIGSFYAELLSRISSRILGRAEPKFLLYSAHDLTIASFLSGLGLYRIWPPYASHIEIELWSDNTSPQWYVQVKSNGLPGKIVGCSDFLCPYNQFVAVLTKYVPPPSQCRPTPSS